MPKHTLGPLTANSDAVYSLNRLITIVSGEAKSFEEDEANAARFVACWNACESINPEAVPELLKALLWLVNTSCDVGKSGNPPTMNEHHAAIDAGKAAIAKATDAQQEQMDTIMRGAFRRALEAEGGTYDEEK